MLQFYMYNCDGQYSLALSLMFDDYRVGTIKYISSTIFTTRGPFTHSFKTLTISHLGLSHFALLIMGAS